MDMCFHTYHSTTSQSDHSLLDYEAFCFDVDHQEEKSSGSTTSHSDLSSLEYESFYFDLSIDPLTPDNRSDSHHKEFADELAHLISPPEYDHFYFDIELNDFRLLLSNYDSTFSEEFSEIDPLVSFSSENKDRVFNPGILNRVHFKRSLILLSDVLSGSDIFFLKDSSEINPSLSFPSGNEDKIFDPGILFIDGVLSFTRKTPHLLSDNFEFDKRHIFSEIYLKIISFVSFHPKDKGIRGESSKRLAQKQAFHGWQLVIPYDLEDLRACFQSSNHAVTDHFHDIS
ncbi:hypothetical protein Tco_0745475, partial [Tanacetum coccineum]